MENIPAAFVLDLLSAPHLFFLLIAVLKVRPAD